MLALLLAVVLPNDCKTRRNDLKPTVFAFLYCIWFASRSPILFSLLSFPFPVSVAFLLFCFCKRCHAGLVLQNKIPGMRRNCFPQAA